MDEAAANSELKQLEAEQPALVALLRSTPGVVDTDSGSASPTELLVARALAILGSAKARGPQGPFAAAAMTSTELQLLLNAASGLRDHSSEELERLRDEVAQLRDSQLTADRVRVLIAQMAAATLLVVAAVVGAVVSIA